MYLLIHTGLGFGESYDSAMSDTRFKVGQQTQHG
jgi:hypothetical protein